MPRYGHDNQNTRIRYSTGNWFDVLIAEKNSIRDHALELGATTRLTFGKEPHTSIGVRPGWYSVYQYKFAIGQIHNTFLFNIAAAFDPLPKATGDAYMVFIWAAWKVNF